MIVVVIGSGGREHALCWKIAQSTLLKKLYAMPGNPGMAGMAECIGDVSVGDVQAVAQWCADKAVDLVVVGPEVPLANGVADALHTKGIACCGPTQAASQLEASKGFTKDLCKQHGIPTSAYGRFTDAAAAKEYTATNMRAPYVVKADGLAAGKGVVICDTLEEAQRAIDDILGGQFGGAGASLVVEEFIDGEEVSFFALSDGDNVLFVGSAQDHKRVGDGDTGPNTGGMGTYGPSPLLTPELHSDVMSKVIQPTVVAMKATGTPYVGVMYAGLMVKDGIPYLLEYNARFGDPETQVLMMSMKSDLLPALAAAAKGGLKDYPPMEFNEGAALCVVMAAKGYPGDYPKGGAITGIDVAEQTPGVVVFHAGTKRSEDGTLVSSGGRVLGVTARGANVTDAQGTAYTAVRSIQWTDGFYRSDIGYRAVLREKA